MKTEELLDYLEAWKDTYDNEGYAVRNGTKSENAKAYREICLRIEYISKPKLSEDELIDKLYEYSENDITTLDFIGWLRRRGIDVE